MEKQYIIDSIAKEVANKFINESGGHDWWHIWRVWQMSKKIAEAENANTFIVEAAVLLHDVADWKYHDGDETIGGNTARAILENYKIQDEYITIIVQIVNTISFKGAGVPTPMDSLEGMIVQDADRLDAIGAIGIARTFAFGGMKGRSMYDPTIKPDIHNTFDAYKNSTAPTINHFYEKLLLLKDRMNTNTAKQLAKERHVFMEVFLETFYREWELNSKK